MLNAFTAKRMTDSTLLFKTVHHFRNHLGVK